MIGMKSKDAIKLGIVKIDQSEKHQDENLLPEDGLYRYLYLGGEQHENRKRWGTDFIWSKNTYTLYRIVEVPDNYVLYCLLGEPDWAFVHEKLMHIPEDNQVPPEWISNGSNHT